MLFPVTPGSVFELLLVLGGLLLTPLMALHARRRSITLRALPGLDLLHDRMAGLAEAGAAVQIATGANQSGGQTLLPSGETLGSLQLAGRVAEAAARRAGTVTADAGDITSYLALRGLVHSAYQRAGFGADYRGTHVHLLAHNAPTAYAAGVAAQMRDAPALAVVAGNYGAEALLISEEAAARQVPTIAATPNLLALPVLTLSADATLVGEDLFAAEAYLADAPRPAARLLTHDLLRRILLGLLALGLLWQLAARWLPALGIPALS